MTRRRNILKKVGKRVVGSVEKVYHISMTNEGQSGYFVITQFNVNGEEIVSIQFEVSKHSFGNYAVGQDCPVLFVDNRSGGGKLVAELEDTCNKGWGEGQEHIIFGLVAASIGLIVGGVVVGARDSPATAGVGLCVGFVFTAILSAAVYLLDRRSQRIAHEKPDPEFVAQV